MYPLPKEVIIEEYKKKFGISLNPDSDFTKLPDEVLANAHLYDWVDKLSVQANVEMSRRLKNAITEMDKSTTKYSKHLIWLTWALIGIGTVTVVTMIWQIILSR